MTGPARTSAPATHADSLGTTIDIGADLDIRAGAAARLAGVTVDGDLDVHGAADTLFRYDDGAGGPTESVFASLVNGGGVRRSESER